jgi:hypothetical protein
MSYFEPLKMLALLALLLGSLSGPVIMSWQYDGLNFLTVDFAASDRAQMAF